MSGISAPQDTTGVVVMAYGTPRAPSDIEAYYTHIRRGRPPTPEQLDELTARYEAIGGISPLAERTEAQRRAIGAALERRAPGRFSVRIGQKHAAPSIEDAVAQFAADGVSSLVGVVLAPHFSAASVGEYLGRAAASAAQHSIAFDGIESWSDLDAYVTHQARSLDERLATMPPRCEVMFTAHSLPERVLAGDPYPDQLLASATEIARRSGLAAEVKWGLGWQSAGRTPEPWRGPDILAIIDDLAATRRAEGLVVVPQGFTSDHLEVLYDLDIEAATRARAAGLAFARTQVVNDDPEVMGALAERIARVAESAAR